MNDLFSDIQERSQAQGFALDFKRVFAKIIRFWYVVVLCLVIALTIAFYKTRYTERIYPVSASIIIREMQETGGGELLYKNALIDAYRNYLNEPYIIRSYPLIEEVIKELNFHVSFYREGYFMTTETYNYVPIKAVVVSDKAPLKTGQFIFQLVDKDHFSLKRFHEESFPDNSTVFSLNDSIQFEDQTLRVTAIPERDVESYIGVPFLLVIQDPTVVAGSYIRRLRVDWAEEGAGIINLGLTGTNPEKEIDFLSKLISEYRKLDLEKKNETAERTIDFIKSQLLTIKDSLKTVEYQLERFGNGSRIKDMSADAQRFLAKAEGLEVQKSELLIRQKYFQYLTDYIKKNAENLDQVILPSSVGITDPILTSLLSKMVELQLEIKLNVGSERGKNPLIANKIERIRQMKNDVEEAVKTLKSTDKIKMDFINGQLRSAEAQLSSLPASERQLIAVQRNYALLENLYVFLMQKLSEAGISKASNTSDIIPVNPPMKAGAISPKPFQNFAIATLIGLALPLAMFILVELLNNKVQSKEDIERITKVPFIGGVGHKRSNNNLQVLSAPKSSIAESFRALRSNLNYFLGQQQKAVFLITSSLSGEGKTFTSLNLASVFALSGKKTLIVGADMRKPKIFHDFSLSNDVGLSNYLAGISDFDAVVQRTKHAFLDLVSGGPVPPNPSELLLNEKMKTFMEEAKERYDYVIIDTPPLAIVTDAFVLTQFADHTLFLVRQNYTPKLLLKTTHDFYASGKLKNISIVLNDIYKSGPGYGYGYGYAYGYGYYGNSKGGGYYSDEV